MGLIRRAFGWRYGMLKTGSTRSRRRSVQEKLLLNARSARDLVSEDVERDPEFRVEWERTALARAVALVVVGYRAKHKLSQRKLAELLEWKPSQVARLELGEHNPSLDTLIFLSQRVG